MENTNDILISDEMRNQLQQNSIPAASDSESLEIREPLEIISYEDGQDQTPIPVKCSWSKATSC